VSPALILVRPEREPREIKDLALRAREAALALDTSTMIKTFRTSRGTVVGEAWHRPVQFLQPNDARELYRLVHRWRVLVLSFTSVYVRRDPSRQPAERRAALELGTFVEHKAQFWLVRGRPGLQLAVAGLACTATCGCDGDDDPRYLPLHAFSVDRPWGTLSDQHGRDAFEDLHGPARSRVDADKKRWTRADRGAYHGREALTIAGRDLPRGMHWDVTSERGLGRLTTANEVWRLPRGPRGHINVYPDAYVRPKAGSSARRVWPVGNRGRP